MQTRVIKYKIGFISLLLKYERTCIKMTGVWTYFSSYYHGSMFMFTKFLVFVYNSSSLPHRTHSYI